eukprot:639622-Pelagomonas_calceolata.AAC.1
MKPTVLQYRTGTLYNQKRAVRFKTTINPAANHIIPSMKTERNNVAGRMIIRALSKSPWEA